MPDIAGRVAGLAGLAPEAFAQLVASSLGDDADPELWDALADKVIISRTKNALGALDRDLLAQLARANAELDEERARCWTLGDAGRAEFARAKAAQGDWRRRMQGFRRLVLRRKEFVSQRAAALHAAYAAAHPPSAPGTGKTARKHNRMALEILARAVAEHRRRVMSGDGDESDDEALWDHLVTVTAISMAGDELPLAEWLQYLDDLKENDDDSK
jgi:hypothetical protein